MALMGHRQLLAVQLVLQRLGRREAQLLGSCDSDGRAGRRIATLASRAVLDLELAKSGQRDFFSLDRRVPDCRQHAVDDLLCVALCDALGASYGVCQLVGMHMRISC